MRARLLRFIIVFTKEDLPTFDLPTNTISGKLPVGYCLGLTADISNFGFFTNIIISFQFWLNHSYMELKLLEL